MHRAHLTHETWDDAVERDALEVEGLPCGLANARFPGAKRSEIFCGLPKDRRPIHAPQN